MGGFTWTFQDYLALNLTQEMWTDEWQMALDIIDPIKNIERLKDIPIFMMVASNDEFMQFEWTNFNYDRLPGEKHLYIVSNAEHEMFTAYRRYFSNLASFMTSIASASTARPEFDYFHDNSTGELSIKLKDTNTVPIKRVKLVSAETLTTQRRDFRWMF